MLLQKQSLCCCTRQMLSFPKSHYAESAVKSAILTFGPKAWAKCTHHYYSPRQNIATKWPKGFRHCCAPHMLRRSHSLACCLMCQAANLLSPNPYVQEQPLLCVWPRLVSRPIWSFYWCFKFARGRFWSRWCEKRPILAPLCGARVEREARVRFG